jgi:HD-like signal output (HDOD) protein
VTDISHAISLLGRDVVRTFAIAGAANDAIRLDLSAYSISPEEYLERAQLQHALAVGLAMKISRSSLQHVSLGSYLLELGRVVISRYLIESNQAQIFAQEFKSSANCKALEVEYCGAKSEDVTATIFNHWKFQPDLIYVIRYANEPEDASDEELQIASKILKIAKESISLHGEFTDETILCGQNLMNEYGMQQEAFNQVIEKIRSAA